MVWYYKLWQHHQERGTVSCLWYSIFVFLDLMCLSVVFLGAHYRVFNIPPSLPQHKKGKRISPSSRVGFLRVHRLELQWEAVMILFSSRIVLSSLLDVTSILLSCQAQRAGTFKLVRRACQGFGFLSCRWRLFHKIDLQTISPKSLNSDFIMQKSTAIGIGDLDKELEAIMWRGRGSQCLDISQRFKKSRFIN